MQPASMSLSVTETRSNRTHQCVTRSGAHPSLAGRISRRNRPGMEEPACKPDPVPGPRSRWRPSLSARGRIAPPRRRVAVHPRRAAYPAARTGRPRTLPAWPCSGWGLPSRHGRPCRWCALTAPFHPCPPEEPWEGGLLSVAPSRGHPRLGRPQHPALWSPDFPRPRTRRGRGRPAGSSITRVLRTMGSSRCAGSQLAS
jgi:hypothetical protein